MRIIRPELVELFVEGRIHNLKASSCDKFNSCYILVVGVIGMNTGRQNHLFLILFFFARIRLFKVGLRVLMHLLSTLLLLIAVRLFVLFFVISMRIT